MLLRCFNKYAFELYVIIRSGYNKQIFRLLLVIKTVKLKTQRFIECCLGIREIYVKVNKYGKIDKFRWECFYKKSGNIRLQSSCRACRENVEFRYIRA